MKSSLNPYELARQRRIMENKRRMQVRESHQHMQNYLLTNSSPCACKLGITRRFSLLLLCLIIHCFLH